MSQKAYKSLQVHEGEALPIDTNNATYTIMFYEGVGNLFPWNAFITAAAYYATVGLAISIIYQNSLSLKAKIIWPLLCYSIVFMLTTAMVTFEIESNLLFWLTLISTFLCGLCGAILSGGLFGLAAKFPAAYTGALMNGQGLAGLIVAVSSILTSLASEGNSCISSDEASASVCDVFSINYSALAYFIIATAIMLTCILGFIALQKLEFARYYIEGEEFVPENIESSSKWSKISAPLLDVENETKRGEGVEGGAAVENPISLSIHPINVVGRLESEENQVDERAEGSGLTKNAISLSTIKSIANLLKIPAISVTLTFTITIGIFPSLIVLVESRDRCKSSQRFFNDLFVPFQFLLFNLFDFCGRVTAGAFSPIFSATNVWVPAVARLCFFPLFLLCDVQGSQLPLVFKSDVFPILFMAAFAFSNGYVASACMMVGPSLAQPTDAPLAGTIMIFALTIGLLFGACCSFLTVFMSQGSF